VDIVHTVRGTKRAPDMGKRARGGTRTAFLPLQTLGAPENISNPSQSGISTIQPEAQSVDNVQTFFLPYSSSKSGRQEGLSRCDPKRPLSAFENAQTESPKPVPMHGNAIDIRGQADEANPDASTNQQCRYRAAFPARARFATRIMKPCHPYSP
jgi:hypothetical protein